MEYRTDKAANDNNLPRGNEEEIGSGFSLEAALWIFGTVAGVFGIGCVFALIAKL